MLCACGCGQETGLAKQTRFGVRKGEPLRYIRAHHFAPVEERIAERVIKSPDGCWEWTGGKNKQGYGVLRWRGKQWRVHRLVLAFSGANLQSGQWACHRCDNPSCVRPDHLYAGTPAQNNRDTVQRRRRAPPKTHCKRGHALTEDNVFRAYSRAGVVHGRRCRECTLMLNRQSLERKKARATSS